MDEATVRAKYRALGYKMGWTFAMTPLARMTTAETALVGLNPGGSEGGEEVWEVSSGNAYFDERWGENGDYNSLQLQVAALFHLIGLTKDDVFAAQFIPFRSSGLDRLDNQIDAVAFGRALWEWVIAQSPARRYICLGQLAASNLASLLGASLKEQHPSGWGATTIGRYVANDGRVVVELPHLSRYQLLSLGNPEGLEKARAGILACARLE